MLMTAYRCSVAADQLWSRLLRIWALSRDGDVDVHGQNWAEQALARASGPAADLGTRARLEYVAAQRALALLETFGGDAERAARLARCRLSGHGLGQECQRMGIERDRGESLLEGAKEFMAWHLDVDTPLDLPELP